MFLGVGLYLPDALMHLDPDTILTGINYCFDTLLFAGAILLVASPESLCGGSQTQVLA
jgi:hypothetical protein